MAYFPSKRSLWMRLITWVVIPVTAISPVAAVAVGQANGATGSGLAVAVAATLFVIWLYLSTGYQVTERELVVRAAFLRWRVPLAEVTRIRPTRNPLASPALSLDRLEVRWGRGRSILISPDQRQAFLELMRTRCPQAQIDE